MQRHQIAAVAGLVVALAASTAAAEPVAPVAPTVSVASTAPAELVRWLDADLTVLVRLDADELERFAGFARSLGGPLAGGVALAALGGVRYLGFDPMSRAGWIGAGLDPASPIVAELATIDSTSTDRVYRELARTGGQFGTHRRDSPPLWRTRIVARATDPARLIARLGRSALIARSAVVDAAHGAELAELLRAGPRDVVRDLVGRGVLLVGIVPAFGSLLFVRSRADIVIIDLVSPFAGDQLEWPRDRRALLEHLTGPSRRRISSNVHDAAARPGIGVWTHPAGLHDLSQAWRATSLLRRRFGGEPLPDVVRGCARLAGLERATLADLGIGARVVGRSIDLTVRYRHRGGLVDALATADDQLLPGLPIGDLSGRLALAGVAGLRGLPRLAILDRGWDWMRQNVDWCGVGAEALVDLFAWPELAGAWLDEMARAVPGASPIVDGLGNIGIAIERLAPDRRALVGVVEIALSPTAQATAIRGLDALFGPSTASERPRAHRRWGKGPLHPYLLGERGALGAGFGTSTAWRLGLPAAAERAAPAASPAPPPPLLTLRGRFDRVVGFLTDGAYPAITALAARLGGFRLGSVTTADSLELRLSIERREP